VTRRARTARVAAEIIGCTVNVDGSCGMPAAQLLIIEGSDGIWTVSGRCLDHPAEEWEPILARTLPHLRYVILNLASGSQAEEEPVPDDYDPGPECDDQGGMSEYRHQLPSEP
jgi:hypothetical protein